MAFITRRKGRFGIFAYYHDRNTGKQKQIPRKLLRHLDKLPIEQAQAWVNDWEQKNGMVVQRAQRINLSPDDRLLALWNQYQKHRKSTRKRRDVAEKRETQIFESHIVPFFVGEKEKKRPESWHDHVPEFHTHLFEKKLKDQTIRYILWTLERFGKHLVWSRQMPFPFAIQTPARENHKITPLKVRLTPEQVLNYVVNEINEETLKKAKKIGGPEFTVDTNDIKLTVLIGFFANLRPSEQWALNKSDFYTGDFAEENTKTLQHLKKYELGSRLSIAVTKTWQRHKDKPATIEELTKSHYSHGVVNVWNKDAAVLIGKILKAKPDGRIFSLSYDGWFQFWRKVIKPTLKVTAHDLRRAGGHYLGRVKRLDLTLLQEHMRHAEIETTMLYTRDPVVPEVRQKKVSQDFDDLVF